MGKLSRLAGSLLAVGGLAGCGMAAAAGQGSSLGACVAPGGSQFIAVVTDSASERSGAILAERESALAGFAARALSCRTPLSVVFDPGQSLARVIYSGGVHINAATETSYRRRAAMALRSEILPGLDAALVHAESGPAPAVGSPVSAFQVLADDRSPAPLEALVLSDMVQSDDHVNLDRPLDPGQVTALAATESVPRLDRARISVEGVGVTADRIAAPDDWLRALRAFTSAVCGRTGAACSVTTQVG